MSANLLFSRQPGNANNDVVAIALFLAAIAILLNTRRPRPRRPPGRRAAVAGLAAGLALGTKLTVVPPVLALTVGVIVIAGAGDRGRAAAGLDRRPRVGGGLWYIRNLVVAGNPLPGRHRPDDHAGGAPGPPPLLDRPLRHRHRRLGPVTSPPASTSASATSGRSSWCWRRSACASGSGRGGRLERMLAAVALSRRSPTCSPRSGPRGGGSTVGFRLNIRYLAPGLALALS